MSVNLRYQDDFELIPENSVRFGDSEWYGLCRVGGKKDYETRFKAVYSDTGIYFLFCCGDQKITAELEEDGSDLFTEDVIEIFLQPDQAYPVYMEYEISPLNRELVLLVSHNGEKFYGWMPFHYTGGRRTKHITWSKTGVPVSGAALQEWWTMIYIPFSLFEGVMPVKVSSGTVWRGNIFRIDYDHEEVSRYAYATACGTEFHDYEKFDKVMFL